MNTETIRKLLAALGITLGAESAEEQVSTAVNEATTAAGAAVAAKTELEALKPQLTAAQNEAATTKAQLLGLQGELATVRQHLAAQTTAATNERAARARLVVAAAVADGRIVEAHRADFEGRLVSAANDAAFAVVESEIKGLRKAVNTQAHSAGLGQRRAASPASQTRISAINEALVKYKADHPGVTHNAAFEAVRTAQPALFEATNAD